MKRLTSRRMFGFVRYEDGVLGEIIERPPEGEDSLGDDYDLDRLRELVEADLDDRCVILKHTTVSDLRQQFTTLSSVCDGDDTETYTTGYRNGHRNGRVELLQYILGIPDGAREAAEVALKARERNE